VALGCAAASARRIGLVVDATWLHPEDTLQALEGGTSVEALRALVAAEPAADWERDLLAALDATDERARAALVNEQLAELDYRQQRWARVPRVCASLATTAGLLLATLVLRRGLLEAGDLAGEGVVRGLVGDALTVVAFGIAGTVFCIAAQGHAKRLVRARTRAADRLVEKLETLVAARAG
jgi:hypothetical protein